MTHIQASRGTKDILAPAIDSWRIIEEVSREVLELANYKEIRTPIFENSNLYSRSLGQITDIVQKEMYSFKDRGQRDITLRPEGTAGVVRAFIEHKLYTETSLQRLWYVGPMFRYERPQAGRQRQFHQLGIESIGSADPRIDAEIVSLAVQILNKLKIPDLDLEINSLGNIESRNQYKEVLYNYLVPYLDELDPEAQNRLKKNPLRLLDSKDSKIQLILDEGPKIIDYLDPESLLHFNKVCGYLSSIDINYKINPKLVRGLDYYNKTTFEIKSTNLGAQDTICGGGRYDNLVKSLGGPSIPAVGWAIGIERLILAILDNNEQHLLPLDCYIITLGDEANNYSLKLVKQLREKNLKVEMSLSDTSLQKQLRKANQLKARTCLILGKEELNQQQVILKWLDNELQELISLGSIDQIGTKIKSKI
uniref:histidine-tRNA synthetase n=1 Tax=Rhodaphanes brevistipitata TaxID=446136 RepID=UPI001FCD1320|nr:histidine-tRNA synthetase [Rhodaphanes brevistipitata]UNJ18564.1 histidine-tRNA synthetase [Rhodaphanes brevistipitata]